MSLLPRIAYPVAVAATALAAGFLATPSQAQTVVPAQSQIGFTIKQMGVPVDGRFAKFDAKVAFDPKKPEAGNISFTVPLAAAEIGDSETTRELAKPEWFNTAKFPSATFQSGAIKALGGGKFEVRGKLAIKGSSRDVVVPVTLANTGGNATASGQFTLKRLEFKIGDGEWADTSMVADEVQVKFKLALTGMAPA